MPGEGVCQAHTAPKPLCLSAQVVLCPVTAVLHCQQQDLLLRAFTVGAKQGQADGVSPGGLQGSSVRAENVHQDPKELLEPEGNRDLPWHTPHHKSLHTSLGTRNPKPRERRCLPSMSPPQECPWLLSTGCLGSDIVLLHLAAGPVCGEGSPEDSPAWHVPFVCFMAAGIARGSKVQREVAGKCPHLSQDAPGLMVKQPRVFPALPAPGHCQSELGAGTSTPGHPAWGQLLVASRGTRGRENDWVSAGAEVGCSMPVLEMGKGRTLHSSCWRGGSTFLPRKGPKRRSSLGTSVLQWK